MKTHVLQASARRIEFKATNIDPLRDGYVDTPVARTVLGIGEVAFFDHQTDDEFVRIVSSTGIEIEPLNGTVDVSEFGRRCFVITNIGE